MTNPKQEAINEVNKRLNIGLGYSKESLNDALDIALQAQQKIHEEEIQRLNNPEVRFAKDVKCLKDYGRVLLKEQREAIREWLSKSNFVKNTYLLKEFDKMEFK